MHLKHWIVLGIVIRLLVSILTYHPDTHFMVMSNYFVNTKGMFLNFYDYLGRSPDPLASVQPASAFTYPPLGIIVDSFLTAIPYWLIGSHYIEKWLISPQIAHNPQYFFLILFTKIPYFFADLGIGYLLYKLTTNRKVLLFWIFNPISIYAAYAVGQFDLIPTLLSVLAVYLVQIKRPLKAAFALGLGGASKMFPILFLPALLLYAGKTIQDKLKIMLAGIAGYLLIVIPYFLTSPGFRTYAIFSPQSDKMFFAKINLTGSEYISVFLLAYVISLGLMFLYRRNFLCMILAVLICFFGFTHYHPQWMVWITPFAALSVYQNQHLKWSWALWFLCFLIVVLSFDQSLNWGITVFARNLSNLTDFVPPVFEVSKYVSLIRSFAAGIGIIILTMIMRTSPIRNLKQ